MYATSAMPDPMPQQVAAVEPPEVWCYYNGNAYTVGSLARMGRAERVCTLVDGAPMWVRDN